MTVEVADGGVRWNRRGLASAIPGKVLEKVIDEALTQSL